MKKIGITGGIGSGKSLVCHVFKLFGVPIYEADERAKWLTQYDPILKADIVRLLGQEAYDQLGNYNRAFVASQVFAYPEKLQALNALIHPRVYADTEQWINRQHAPYVIKEAAIMRAAGDQNNLDAVVVVTAPLALRVERIRKRDSQRSEAEIRAIIDRQISDEARLKLANYVLDNGESELIIPQIIKLHEQFCR